MPPYILVPRKRCIGVPLNVSGGGGGGGSGFNALILALSYPNGSTPTVTDNNGNTWPASPAVSADAGSGNYVASIFVLPKPNSGQTTLTVSFAGTVQPFNYALTEVTNVAAIPVDVSAHAAAVSGTGLATGTMTPTQSGDLVWAYFAVSQAATQNPTGFSAGGSFTLLDADIAWVTNADGFPHASQYWVQPSAGSVNPGITSTGDTQAYNCVAVALKALGGTPKVIQHIASSATPVGERTLPGNNYKIPICNPCGATNPVGLYINKIIHFTDSPGINNTTWNLQFPCVGNFRLLSFAVADSQLTITGITDSDGNSYTNVAASNQPYIWYAKDTTPNPNLVVHVAVTTNGGGNITPSVRCYDISGAHATSPVDAFNGAGPTTANSVTSAQHQPDLSVPTSGDLVIASAALFLGPGFTVTTSGGVFDLCTYSGESDSDLMENADLAAHFYNVAAATLNVAWTFSSQSSNSINSTAIAIKSA